MKDWQHWLITCYFPSTQDEPSYSVRYLIKTPVIAYPFDQEDQSFAGLIWDERHEVVQEHFLPQYKQQIGHDFNGEILYVEEQDVVVFEASRPMELEHPA